MQFVKVGPIVLAASMGYITIRVDFPRGCLSGLIIVTKLGCISRLFGCVKEAVLSEPLIQIVSLSRGNFSFILAISKKSQ